MHASTSHKPFSKPPSYNRFDQIKFRITALFNQLLARTQARVRAWMSEWLGFFLCCFHISNMMHLKFVLNLGTEKFWGNCYDNVYNKI